MRGLKTSWALALSALLAVLLMASSISDWAYDWKSGQRVLSNPAVPVVVVDIDEASLQAVGAWPWSRARLQQLLSRLVDEGQASVVGLDLLLPQSSDEKSDLALAQWLKDRPVVASVAFDFNSSQRTGSLPTGMPLSTEATQSPLGYLGLYPALAESGVTVGHINSQVDLDGKTRQVPSWLAVDGQLYPPLALAMLYELLGRELGLQSWLEMVAPVLSETELWVPQDVPVASVIAVSAADVLEGRVDLSMMNQAMVLVGSSSLGLGDVVTTATTARVPGVVLQAQLLYSALENRWIKDLDRAGETTVLGVVLWTLLVITLWHMAVPFARILGVMSIALALVIGLNVYHFVVLGLNWPLLPWLGLFALQALVMMVSAYRKNASHIQYVESMFKSYVPDRVLDQLIEGDFSSFDQGERRVVTVMFADLVGFTALSEKTPPEELTRKMRLIFNRLSEVILAHNGTIDKYMGDAVMAFWGAPLEDERQAENAVRAAKAMIDAVEELDVGVRLGIGLNTGEVIVGNMGSDFRHAYSVLGDAVNVAARLESKTREFEVDVLLGKSTAKQCGFPTRWVGALMLKGKSKCVDVYSLLD